LGGLLEGAGRVTGSVRGGAVLLMMKLVCRAKKSWFPAPPKARTRFAAKARKGTPGGGGTMPTPEGPFPTVIGNPGPVSTVLLAVNPQYKVIAPL
jgi:hypothetical protein